MSEEWQLVIFAGDPGGWSRFRGQEEVARGERLVAIPVLDEDEAREKITLLVPGSDVSVHWAELPSDLTPAQAQAASRLLASDVCAAPLDTMHVALGSGETISDDTDDPQSMDSSGSQKKCMALVSNHKMARWLETCQSAALDPDTVIPVPLAMAVPDDGVNLYDTESGVTNARGQHRAFAAESELATLILADEKTHRTDTETFIRTLPATLATAPVNLRQGEFAKHRRWAIDWPLVRRLAKLAAATLAVSLLIQLVLLARYDAAADSLYRQAQQVASEAAPGIDLEAELVPQLRSRLQSVGGGSGYSELAATIFDAVRASEGAELQSLVYSSDTGMEISVALPDAQSLENFRQSLATSGLAVSQGGVRSAGARQLADFTVTAQ